MLLCAVVACAGDRATEGKTASAKPGEPAKPGELAKAAEPEKNPEPAKPSLDPAYAKDIDRICNAPKYSGTEGIADPNERIMKMSRWLRENLKTAEGKKLMASFATLAPAEREGVLRGAAEKAGLDSCAIADGDGK